MRAGGQELAFSTPCSLGLWESPTVGGGHPKQDKEGPRKGSSQVSSPCPSRQRNPTRTRGTSACLVEPSLGPVLRRVRGSNHLTPEGPPGCYLCYLCYFGWRQFSQLQGFSQGPIRASPAPDGRPRSHGQHKKPVPGEATCPGLVRSPRGACHRALGTCVGAINSGVRFPAAAGTRAA